MRKRLVFVAGLAAGYVLGTRAGRERYEQLRDSVRQFAQNPAVRNTAETATQTGRQAASRVAARLGDRVPAPIAERLRALGESPRTPYDDDWGASR